MHLYADASESLGWGAFWSGCWLQALWSLNQSGKPIVWKELFAIVNAVNTWGYLWAKQKILFHCDNQAVVDIWHRGSTHDSETMALVCFLYFCAARYDINVVITYISGIDNCTADSLSRFQLHCFRELAPEAHPLLWSHPCMAKPILFTSVRQFIFLGVAPPTRQTYNSGIKFIFTVLLSI